MNFTLEPTEFVLNLQGRCRAQCILHQCIPVNIRLFMPYLKVQDSFVFSVLVLQICFTHSVREKCWMWLWQWFPLASHNLSSVTKTFFIAHLISVGGVQHTALLMFSCRLS